VQTIQEIVDHILGFQDEYLLNPGHVVDVTYSELIADPMAVVQRIYNRFGISLSETAAGGMRSLVLNRSRYRRKDGRSRSTDSILNRVVDASRFEAYCSHFGVS
jgi:LPS sulfotransferase NodH